MKCKETLGKWCKNKHGASKILDTLEMYQCTKHNQGCITMSSNTSNSIVDNLISGSTP
jgi:hypothetical protein